MTYSLHGDADAELADAFAYYREHGGDAVASAFLDEFARVASLLDANPGFGTPAGGGRRIYPLRRFAYSLIYRSAPAGAYILAVAHQHRRPRYWRGRK